MLKQWGVQPPGCGPAPSVARSEPGRQQEASGGGRARLHLCLRPLPAPAPPPGSASDHQVSDSHGSGGPWPKGPPFGLCVGGKLYLVVSPYVGQLAEFYFSGSLIIPLSRHYINVCNYSQEDRPKYCRYSKNLTPLMYQHLRTFNLLITSLSYPVSKKQHFNFTKLSLRKLTSFLYGHLEFDLMPSGRI